MKKHILLLGLLIVSAMFTGCIRHSSAHSSAVLETEADGVIEETDVAGVEELIIETEVTDEDEIIIEEEEIGMDDLTVETEEEE